MMKSQAVLLIPTWDVTHPFVQHLRAAHPPPPLVSHLVALLVIRSAVEVSQSLCSSHPAVLNNGPEGQE